MSRNWLRSILALIFILGACGSSRATDSASINALQNLYRSLLSLNPTSPASPLAPSRLAHQDLSITIGSGRMTQLQLAIPAIDDVDSLLAVWIEAPLGIQFSPQLPMEQERLRHLVGAPELFRSPTACLLIADARVGNDLRPGTESIIPSFAPRTTSSTLESLRRVLGSLQKQEAYLTEEIVRAAVHPTEGRFFLLIWPHDSDWEVYLFDPHEREEVELFRLRRGGAIEPLARYSRYADTTYFLLSGVQRPEVTPLHYELTVHLDQRDGAKIEGSVSLISDRPGLRFIRFRLDPRLNLSRITVNSYSTELLHSQPSLLGDRVILIDPPAQFGDTIQIQFNAAGVLRDKEKRFDIGSTWYPVFGYGDRASFAVTVVAPANLTIVPSGNMTPEVRVQASTSSRKETAISFRVDLPVSFVSFGAAKFRQFTGHANHKNEAGVSDSGDSVLVFLNDALRPTVTNPNFTFDPQEGADDLAEIWQFFQERLGALPWSTLRVHDLFGWHGRSYPGLVQIGWHTFYPSDLTGYNSQFRGHEVAHQWFGVATGFDSYHDEWLSEGISEYLGLCYVQARYGEAVFRGWLEEYRRGLLTIRDNERKSGEAPGALALGYRTASSERQKDYDLVVYRKGAWVVHMLRGLLTNPKTGDDHPFWQMLREFCDRFRGRKATTRDVQFLAEKYSGADLNWYFRQWLYGNAIPKFSLKWTSQLDSTSNDSSLRFLIDLDITQTETEPDFQSWLPVRVEYVDHTSADFRLLISGRALRYQLPTSAQKPVRVILDPNMTLLARF